MCCTDVLVVCYFRVHSVILVIISLLFGLFVCAIGCDQVCDDAALSVSLVSLFTHVPVIAHASVSVMPASVYILRRRRSFDCNLNFVCIIRVTKFPREFLKVLGF